MAADVELSQVARYALRRLRNLRQGHRRGDRQQVPDPMFRSGRNRARPAGARRRLERYRRDVQYRPVLLRGKGPDLHVRYRHSVRAQYPHAARLAAIRRRHGADERALQEIQRVRHTVRQHRGADGRLLPQGDQHGRRSQGPKDAHRRRDRRPRHGQARRGPAAARGRRHLSGAGEGHRRRRRMGRSLRRREARVRQDRQILLLPRLVGGGAQNANMINLDKWNELPPAYRSIIRTASALQHEWELAKYDAGNPEALKRLVSQGAQLRPFPPAVMEAALGAALELYREVSAENPLFKKVWESTLAFRNDQYLWWQIAEYGYDTYLIRTRTRV